MSDCKSHTVCVSEPCTLVPTCQDYETTCAPQLYPWKEQCPPLKPWVPCDSPLTALDIERRSEDAVVRVFTQTSLTAAPAGPPPAGGLPFFTGALGQSPTTSYDTYYTFGNGFRTKNGLIVCPAHLVLLPPNLLQYYRLYQDTSPTAAPTGVPDGSKVQRAARILIDVFNVNGSGHSFTYEAQIYGVDGANDTALLYIPSPNCNGASCFNVGVPCIRRCHPHLEFGCSRQYRNTEPAYVVGDTDSSSILYSINQGGFNSSNYMGFSSRGILSTTVKQYKHVDYTGLAQPELILLAGSAYISSGAPILDKYGHVIGMHTLSTVGNVSRGDLTDKTTGDGTVGGPSQFSMIRSLTLLDQAVKGYSVPQATPIHDSVSGTTFFLLGHAYLGVAWDLVTAATYGSYIDSTSGVQVPRYELPNDPTQFTCGPDKKVVVGVRVRALAGQQVTPTPPAGTVDSLVKYIAVPGSDRNLAAYKNFVDSPLNAKGVKPNDIIYEINCMHIGELHDQAALSLALWALKPGDTATLKIRTNTDSYNVINTVSVVLASMPNWVNFPWYAYGNLPVEWLFNGNPELQQIMPPVPVSFVAPGPAVNASYFPSI